VQYLPLSGIYRIDEVINFSGLSCHYDPKIIYLQTLEMKFMKRVSFLVSVLLSAVIGLSFTSCLNSEGDSSWDYAAYVTVPDMYPYYGLLDDNGYTFNPTNPSALAYANQPDTYVQRALVYLKLAEGEQFVEGKLSYKVTIVDATGIPTEEFNTRPDTLTHDYGLRGLSEAWGINGYINVGISFNYDESAKLGMEQMFDAYDTKLSNDTMYVKLQQSSGGGDNAYQSATYLMSFKAPERYELIGRHPGSSISGDSVVVKISGLGASGGVLKTIPETFKIKI
jgi:hypothetical protein